MRENKKILKQKVPWVGAQQQKSSLLDNRADFCYDKIMNAYFIAPKGIFSKSKLNKIEKVARVNFLYTDNDKNLKQLKKDKKPKVIIYDPDFAGWSFPDSIIENVKNIKAVFLGTTDQSYINQDMCAKKGTKVINIPRYATDSVAEYMIFYMFACAKKLPMQIKNNNKQDFSEKYLQIQVKDKSVGIIGLGNIGQKVADICYGIGMNVRYWDKSIKQVNFDRMELEDIFKDSDIIFLTLSINDATKNIISDSLLKSMKKHSIFISCTGDKLYNASLLRELIDQEKIFGYALEDPQAESEQYGGNAMVTSEYGWFTKEAAKKRLEIWYDNVISYFCEELKISKSNLVGSEKKIISNEPLYCNVRKATLNDIPELMKLYSSQGWTGEHNSIKSMRDHYEKYIDSDRYYLLVAEHRGGIIGTVQANVNNAEAFDCMDFMVMDYLLVKKQYRRRKVGTQLVQKLFEICRERNLESLWLVSSQTRSVAHKFYQYQNFNDIVQGFRKTFRKVPWVNDGK